MSDAPELKPCPCCGSDKRQIFRHSAFQKDPSVICIDCYTSAVTPQAWNTRSDTITALEEENKRLREALGKVRDGYGPNHLSKYARDIASAALKGE